MAVATWCGASSAIAQSHSDRQGKQTWSLEGLRAGYCVHFLVDPRREFSQLDKGFTPIPATRYQDLHPALGQIIQAQPEFASWTPSRLCFYYLSAVRAGNRRISDKDARKPQMIAVWTLGATQQRSGMPRNLVLGLYAGSDRLAHTAGATRIRVREVKSGFSKDPETGTDRHSVKIGKTLLVWNGRAAGDSTRVADPITEPWSGEGARNLSWTADLTLSPTWSRDLVGSLRVEGKGDLADALRASPIRFVGPLYYGGGGELNLSN
jgi:hypothetical protein